MQNYTTKDFYLAAYLNAIGIDLLSHTRANGLTTFAFEHTESLKEAVAKFYALEATVNPVLFGNSLRNLKSIIHAVQGVPGTESKPNHTYVKQSNNRQ